MRNKIYHTKNLQKLIKKTFTIQFDLNNYNKIQKFKNIYKIVDVFINNVYLQSRQNIYIYILIEQTF